MDTIERIMVFPTGVGMNQTAAEFYALQNKAAEPTPGAMARVAGTLYADASRLYPVIVDKEKAEKSKDFNDLGMPASEVTLAKALKARGYHTLHIGKWHLGSTAEMRPNNQGFDETLFMESGLYLPEKSPDVVNSKQDFEIGRAHV